jgi:hypothetical protein
LFTSRLNAEEGKPNNAFLISLEKDKIFLKIVKQLKGIQRNGYDDRVDVAETQKDPADRIAVNETVTHGRLAFRTLNRRLTAKWLNR